MSKLQAINADFKAARIAKDSVRAVFLSTLLSDAQRPGLDDGKRESTDAEVMAVVKKFLKGLNESIAANNGAVTPQQAQEQDILNGYLPQQLSEAALKTIIAEQVAALDAPSMKDMGRIMGALKGEYDGQYDGKVASVLVKAALANT